MYRSASLEMETTPAHIKNRTNRTDETYGSAYNIAAWRVSGAEKLPKERHRLRRDLLFRRRFVPVGDRTGDQMIQAARSGKQNIVEGSMASAVSKETEIKLTGVARGSLEELLEDFRD